MNDELYLKVCNLFELSWAEGPTAPIDTDDLPQVVSPQSRRFAGAVLDLIEEYVPSSPLSTHEPM